MTNEQQLRIDELNIEIEAVEQALVKRCFFICNHEDLERRLHLLNKELKRLIREIL